MILRHKAPVTGVERVMTVVTHHPIVIHLKGILLGFLAIDDYLTVLHLKGIALVCTDRTLVNGDII
jgi:hypothetical protein